MNFNLRARHWRERTEKMLFSSSRFLHEAKVEKKVFFRKYARMKRDERKAGRVARG